MAKMVAVVFADVQSHADMGRLANALELVKEAKQNADEVELIFDGAGVQWIPQVTDPEHRLHKIYESIQDKVTGVCAYCAAAFQVKAAVEKTGVKLLSEFEGHPSLRARIAAGSQVVTF